jgi:hypothetical protein
VSSGDLIAVRTACSAGDCPYNVPANVTNKVENRMTDI